MSLGGILLGIINMAIVVAILLLVGAIILWFCSWMGIGVPANVQKGYIAVVALIALYHDRGAAAGHTIGSHHRRGGAAAGMTIDFSADLL